MATEQSGGQETRPFPTEGSSGRLQVLATEHWSLLATRSLGYSESFSRVSMFLALLTGAIVSLALLAQVDHFHETFVLAAILILFIVGFVGIVTVSRLSALNRENFHVVMGMNRLRHAYLQMYPELEPYFIAGSHDDARAVMQSMGVPGMPDAGLLGAAFQGLQTLPAMVAVIVALVVGVLGALIVSRLGGSSLLAIAVAAAIFLAMNFVTGFLARRAFFTLVKSTPARFPSP